MKRFFWSISICLLLFPIICTASKKDKLPGRKALVQMADRSLEICRQQALFLAETLEPMENKLPRSYYGDRLHVTDYKAWTSGFFPGVLWQLYEVYDDPQLLEHARHFTDMVEPAKDIRNNHDVGFMIYCSSGHAYRLTGDPHYLDVVMTASESLISRYDESLGVIRSWDWNSKWKYPVIIDNMMNLEMLCFASEVSGDSKYVDIARKHADTTIKNHFRDDYSTWHVVSYDPETGKPHVKNTYQGYSDDSAWSRGQAWGLYGYVMMYRQTGNPVYLKQAKNIASFLVNHPNMPEDLVPYWDFDSPEIPDDVRDASAAAIMASAFLELSTLDDSKDSKLWYKTAVRQLCSLSSDRYQAEPVTCGGFILRHGTGHKPAGSEIDVPLSYADYYYIEALVRLKNMITAGR